jgi:hypothetical protein
MNVIANLLGEDFICYKTDCIYYKDTEDNRKLVQAYFDAADLPWKQLVQPERPTKDVNQIPKNKAKSKPKK